MKNNLVLIGENDNLVVERFKLGGRSVEFVHDTETGYNYFNQKDLSDLFGIGVNTVSKHLIKYLKVNANLSTNSRKIRIELKTSNRGRKTIFYGFDAVTYLAYRVNTLKAIEIRDIISNILNTMFNVATGKTDLDTKISKLENMYEVENQKATDYLKASDMVSFDKELADELMSKHVIAKTNAENCKELIAVHSDWENCYENVVNRKQLFKLVKVSNGRRKPSYRIYKGGEYVKGSIYYNKLVDWFDNTYPNAVLLNRR